jgi:acyl-coenzyme A synthetase/AMP-(fatty) acid ligase
MPNSCFLIDERERQAIDETTVVTGMLSVGGPQVARGYVGDDADQSFYTRQVSGRPIRFYRTGDLVRLETDSDRVHFLGREDNQVKINGVRIELEEIESCISRISGVEGCVVMVNRSGPAPTICAVFKTADNAALAIETVRRACRRALPPPLVPAQFRQVAAFPLKESGKIDRASVLRELTQSA